MAEPAFPFWLALVAPFTTDFDVAELAGITVFRASKLRTTYGIPFCETQFAGTNAIQWHTLLGLLPDAKLSELVTNRFGHTVTAALVKAIRADQGIKDYKSQRAKLTPAVCGLVGRYRSDRISKGWDVPANSVEAYRKLVGIPSADPANLSIPAESVWNEQTLGMFSAYTNTQIAKTCGITIKAVREKRAQLKIENPTKRPYWKEVSEAELNKHTDDELASQFGGPLSDYAEQRLAMQLENLATKKALVDCRRLPSDLSWAFRSLSTRRIAKLTRLGVFILNKQRDELGIEPFSPLNVKIDVLLSNFPDIEIAEAFHIAPATVKSRRDLLGLPPYRKPKAPRK